MKVLVAAASRHGATWGIAEAIADVLRARGLDAEVRAPEDVREVEDYDATVIGSAVYAGHWLRPAVDLIHRSGGALSARPVWLFSSGPVGDPSRKLVQKMAADPVDLPELHEITGAQNPGCLREGSRSGTSPDRSASPWLSSAASRGFS